MNMEQPTLLGIRNVANMLGVGLTTAWGLVATGELETVKIGSRTLVKRESAERVAECGGDTPSKKQKVEQPEPSAAA